MGQVIELHSGAQQVADDAWTELQQARRYFQSVKKNGVILAGGRQCGKTTELEYTAKKFREAQERLNLAETRYRRYARMVRKTK